LQRLTAETQTVGPGGDSLDAGDAVAVGRLADVLRQAAVGEDDVKLLVEVGGVGAAQVVPASVVRLVCDLLDDLSEGRGVTVAPYDVPVGTEAAAVLLGVSRPWVTTLMDRGDLPGERIGWGGRGVASCLLRRLRRESKEA
jgi:hypothetical protein